MARHLSRAGYVRPVRLAIVFVCLITACAPSGVQAPAITPTTEQLPASSATPVPPTPTVPPATPTPSRSAALFEVENEVLSRTTDGAAWQTAGVGQIILAGGGVQTGDDARARLDISDGVIVRLAANSAFELTELSPETADPVTRLKLAVGKLWAAVTGALGGGAFEVETPTGVAAVRGSWMGVEFFLATGRMIVTCLEGLCRLATAPARFTDLTSGQQAEVPGFGKDPSPARPMDAAQYADWAENFPEAPVPTVIPSPFPTETSTPPPTATAAPLTTGAFSVSVPGNAGWLDTGIQVEAGQSVSISASGIANTQSGLAESNSGPEGQNTVCQPFDANSNCLMNGEAYGALIGRIGEGAPFRIGAGLEMTAPASGLLYLAVNDNAPHYDDNSGAYEVTVTIR